MSRKKRMYEINKESLEEKQEQIEICLDFKQYQDMMSKRLLLRDSIIEKVKKKYDRKKKYKEDLLNDV